MKKRNSVGPFLKGIKPSNPRDLDKVLERLDWYAQELDDPDRSDDDKLALELEMGELEDVARRMTCKVTMCAEDNF